MAEEPNTVTAAPVATPVLVAEPLASQLTAFGQELAGDLQIKLEGPIEQQVQQAIRELDVTDTNSIIFYGSKAQQQLTSISDSMLENVRTKDVGPAGDALNNMVQKLRELDLGDVDPTGKPGFFGRLFGVKSEVQKYLDKYEDVRGQVDTITTQLEQHKTKMLTDIVKLDKLYGANLDYFRTLEVYIAGGRAKLKEIDERIIPAMAEKVAGSEDVIEAQKLRDLRAARDDLERRVHDLLLTRQVTMQALPSIRLVQENDKSLVTKINSTIANTVPLWRQQLAQAVTIYRMGEAANSVKAASDLTNELLKNNAENLKQANAVVRRQVERGVFDIETVKEANAKLVATINESLQIADEGKQRRLQAEQQLHAMEAELRKTLAAASARAHKGASSTAGAT
ncbi:MAG: toxic anion resistance protein [Geminicoccaceae bacterium]